MKTVPLISEVLRSLGDFLFPPACPGCGGNMGDDGVLCGGCQEKVRVTVESWRNPPRDIPGVDLFSVLLPYGDFTRTLIHALKYHGDQALGDPLGRLMARKLFREFMPDPETLIVPVPLHPDKRRDRGYNQCERLAEGFAAYSGIAVADGLVERTRNTPTQTALDADTRCLNVSGAFRFSGSRSLRGRHVILIDDVLTTGSTAGECARALREGGAEEVTVCVVATPAIGDV